MILLQNEVGADDLRWIENHTTSNDDQWLFAALAAMGMTDDELAEYLVDNTR